MDDQLKAFEERAATAEKKIAILTQKLDELSKLQGSSSGARHSASISTSSLTPGTLPKGHTAFSWGLEAAAAALSAAPKTSSQSESASKARELLQATFEQDPQRQNFKFGNILPIKTVLKKGLELVDQQVDVAGWARSIRVQNNGKLAFVVLNDGSCLGTLQVIVDSDKKGFEQLTSHVASTGASVLIRGTIVKSPAKGQVVELLATEAELLGGAEPSQYPLAKKKHTLEHLRSIAHLRPRSRTISAMSRIRNALAFATHRFFNENGFLYVHTPLITASDCEGAGEMFSVTTLLSLVEGGNKASINTSLLLTADKTKIDYSKDFFGKPSFLTVSGQLNVENYCAALGRVYTFGPTFRAELSHTTRHLAEFWMIEPEIAFCDLQENINYAEAYFKYCLWYVLEHYREDIEFLESEYEKGLVQKLESLIATPFKRITYTEAIELLLQSKETFEKHPTWGEDLGTDMEKYLAGKAFGKPTVVAVMNYPSSFKAFYMRLNDDQKTVAATDILVPGIGELIGGSQREERLDVLQNQIKAKGLDPAAYETYIDLRRYGSVPHAGFGLGFERLVMLCTGLENIRDVIPFPRYPGHAEF